MRYEGCAESASGLGTVLMTLLKHCDRVKIACLALLVNAVAPIMTENAEDGGRCWLQTIFYPFMHVSTYGRGTVLDGRADSPTYEANQFPFYVTQKFPAVPYLESCAVLSEDGSEITIFAVNRSVEEEMEFNCDLSAFGASSVIEQIRMNHENIKAVNTVDDPFCVIPESANDAAVENGILRAALQPHSWNVIRVKL